MSFVQVCVLRRSINLLVVTIVILAFLSSSSAVSSYQQADDRPSRGVQTFKIFTESSNSRIALSVSKTVSSKDLYVNEPFNVFVRVKNFGNATAYNITLTDEFFPDYLFNTTGFEEVTVHQIINGSTFYYGYELIPLKAGIYNIPATQMMYYDDGGNSYTAESNDVGIEVKEIEPPSIDSQENWLIIGAFLGIFSILILSTRIFLMKFN